MNVSLITGLMPPACTTLWRGFVMNGVHEVYRIRSGDFRILYCQNGDSEVIVLDIGNRNDVYRNR